ncbi:hypothetical protein GOD70_28740, partial [Sinorhizobium medicae]|nr:hypothetical protein [Sinorhizobium medicae]
MKRFVHAATVIRTALLFGALLAYAAPVGGAETAPPYAADQLIAPQKGFVDEKTCTSCHAEQAAAFAKSHHAKAMALADDKSVRADFNSVRFERD